MEAVGEAVTGGLAARAVEPAAGEGGEEGGFCLNCRTGLIGPYCHACGQKAQVHRSITAWWHDLLHGVLHLDGKIWRTLPLLAWRPGELTRRYVEGERARFVSPLALFLFSVFLMFAVFSAMGTPLIGVADEAPGEIAAEVETLTGRLKTLERERAAKAARGEDVAELDVRIRQVKRERDAVAISAKYLGGEAAAADAAAAGKEGKDELFGGKIDTGWPRLDRGLKKANENPDLLFYKLQNNAYKFSWALIPISVPFLWLLFLHRRRYRGYRAYDHLVFVTYSIGFMSLTIIAAVLLRTMGLGGGWLAIALLVIPPVHIYRQLRGAYQLKWWSALWRTFVLLIFAAIAVTLFSMILLALGVLA